MSRSQLDVKGKNEYCLIGLHCPARIYTMHHRISKKLGTNVHHDEAAWHAQDPSLNLKCQNENRLIGLVRPVSQPCIIGFPSYRAHMFTMMRWHVVHKTQACTSKVKVTLRGQRPKIELFDRTVSKMYAVHCCYIANAQSIHNVLSSSCSGTFVLLAIRH